MCLNVSSFLKEIMLSYYDIHYLIEQISYFDYFVVMIIHRYLDYKDFLNVIYLLNFMSYFC